MSAHVSEAWPPKSRVRYVPTVGPVRPATVLHKVSGVDAYTIRLADGRKLTAPASQIQPKIELRPEGA